MIVVLKENVTDAERALLLSQLAALGVYPAEPNETAQCAIRLCGDLSHLDLAGLEHHRLVASIVSTGKPYPLADKAAKEAPSVIEAGGARIGGGHFALIAGPCSVENRDQILAVAQAVKAAGAQILRGGAFKPRTSPYDFQGLHAEGLRYLLEAKRATGLPVISEITGVNDLDLFADVDIIQVGARNMQNFELLKKLGQVKKTVLIKRGMSSTLTELLMSAEYVISGGNENVILCERGIRTFEPYTRNTLDLSAVAAVHELSHLPIVVDPSHATGHWRMVAPMSLAAAAAGCDGLMIEVHNDPDHALSDGGQSITTQRFAALAARLETLRSVL